ncbi:MAG: hypothetical protein KDB61_16435, partial [Planctomycetes bacterium]|nr:hypothetical protein [Planctomycetota bacterium]
PEEIHEKYPWIGHTCPYRDPVFGFLSIDLTTGNFLVQGTESVWVGPSPAQLGADLDPNVTHGQEIAPRIQERRIERAAGSLQA